MEISLASSEVPRPNGAARLGRKSGEARSGLETAQKTWQLDSRPRAGFRDGPFAYSLQLHKFCERAQMGNDDDGRGKARSSSQPVRSPVHQASSKQHVRKMIDQPVSTVVAAGNDWWRSVI